MTPGSRGASSPGHPWLALLALAAATGVARADEFVCPTRGGEDWSVVTSPHLVVRTDLPPARAIAMTREIERIWSVLSRGLEIGTAGTGRVDVVAFASRKQFQAFAPTQETAAYFGVDPLGRGTIVLGGSLGPRQREVIAHELAHQFTFRALQRQPRWLAEGLAMTAESAGRVAGDRAVVGAIPSQVTKATLRSRASVRSTLLWSRDRACQVPRDVTAWLLVTYLLNERRDDFRKLVERLSRGEDPRKAWLHVFPQWDPADAERLQGLEDAIDEMLRRGVYRYREVEVPREPPAARAAPLSPAEVHVTRIRLGGRSRSAAELESELAEALEEDPGNVGALRLRMLQRPDEAEATARQAVGAHPEDPAAWAALVLSLTKQGKSAETERGEAAARGLAIGPDSPEALLAGAIDLLLRERPIEAADERR